MVAMTVLKELGTEADRFLRAISPTDSDKLGSSAETYYHGLVWFQSFLKEQAHFPEIKNIHTFFNAVEADSKRQGTAKTFPERTLLKDFATFLIEKDKAPKTVRSYVGAVQSLFAYYAITINTTYSDLPPAMAVNEKYPWSLEQVREFIKSFNSPMYRCLGVWFLQTGLSNYDLLHMQYSKIKEQYENDVSPFCLNLVRHKTRKFEIKFRAFIGALGIRYFREYYESLPHALSPDDLLFNVSSVAIERYFQRRAKEFLSKATQTTEQKGKKKRKRKVKAEPTEPTESKKKLRNQCCPSSLRTAFRTFLTDGKVTNSEIEYFMGHNLTADLSKTYTNKSDDGWRATWREYEPLLTFKV
jgi:hypothetical protein